MPARANGTTRSNGKLASIKGMKMTTKIYRPPSFKIGKPVYGKTWEEAKELCEKQGGRLPFFWELNYLQTQEKDPIGWNWVGDSPEGSWLSYHDLVSYAHHGSFHPVIHDDFLGFRCVTDKPRPPASAFPLRMRKKGK